MVYHCLTTVYAACVDINTVVTVNKEYKCFTMHSPTEYIMRTYSLKLAKKGLFYKYSVPLKEPLFDWLFLLQYGLFFKEPLLDIM